LIVERGTKIDVLAMPLAAPIKCGAVQAKFFAGENISVMAKSFITDGSEIGGNTYVGFNCMITCAKIGRYVSIANNVSIGPGEHALNQISTSSLFYEDEIGQLTAKDCVIEHDAWIGEGSIIRRGVKVGIGAVVGANSFVNRDVEPFEIVGGSPARVIGYRFEKQKIDEILASCWWELHVDQAKEVIMKLGAA
jgi:acetyltransferase-like isoleucine patch superfamily enzyme